MAQPTGCRARPAVVKGDVVLINLRGRVLGQVMWYANMGQCEGSGRVGVGVVMWVIVGVGIGVSEAVGDEVGVDIVEPEGSRCRAISSTVRAKRCRTPRRGYRYGCIRQARGAQAYRKQGWG